MKQFLKKLIRAYFLITTCTLFSSALFITVFYPDSKLHVGFMWEMLGFSLAATLSIFIIYSSREMGRTELIIRQFIHYLVINFLLIGAGVCWGWFSLEHISQIFVLVAETTVVYAIVCLGLFVGEVNQAKHLNKKIQEYKLNKKSDERL